MEYLMESGSVCGNLFILLSSPTTKAVNDSYMILLNSVEKVFVCTWWTLEMTILTKIG